MEADEAGVVPVHGSGGKAVERRCASRRIINGSVRRSDLESCPSSTLPPRGAAELIAAETTLRELRKARQLTQLSIAREPGITQDGVSRPEQRSHFLLPTLRNTVEAMGGSLSLITRFPDRPPVELSGIAKQRRQVLTTRASSAPAA